MNTSNPTPAAEHPYPQNGNGDPEFSSVAITYDHKQLAERTDHNIVQKIEYSTFDPIERLWALMDASGDAAAKNLPATVETVGRAFNQPVILIYTAADGTTTAFLSTTTLADIIEHDLFGKGSSLLAINAIASWLPALYQRAMQSNNGQVPPVTSIMFPKVEREAETAKMEQSAAAQTSKPKRTPRKAATKAKAEADA